MKNTPWAAPFPKSALSAAVCLGLIVATSNAQAMVLTAEATVAIPPSAPVTDFETDPSDVYAYADDYGPSGDAYASAWGDDSGDMFARSSGNGSFDAGSSIRQSVEFTNTTGTAQNYFFDFTINNGSLSAYDYYNSLAAGEYVQAANDVAIMLNGVDIFTSQATLVSTDSGTTLTTSGIELGTYTTGSDYYSWGTYTGTLDLGVFNPGEGFLLEYDILTSANSNASSSLFGCEGYGGLGDDNWWWLEEMGSCFTNYGASRFGDPNGINGMPISPLTVTSVSVPEPSMLFLLAGGVAGLAFAGRKRARKS